MNLREQLARDEAPVGTWMSLASPAAAEAVAGLGFDFALVDTEHAPLSTESVEDVVRAVEVADDAVDPIVRVAWNDHVRIKRALDVGAAGIMAPQVNTREEAEDLVAATRYPPAGHRGIAGARASDYGKNLDEYVATANEEIAVLAQVESPEAVENVADIAAVDGIDALFVGPADLSGALDVFGEFESETFRDAVENVLDAGDDAGVPVGTLATSDDEIEQWLDVGFDFLIVGTDVGYLTSGAQAAKEAYESRL